MSLWQPPKKAPAWAKRAESFSQDDEEEEEEEGEAMATPRTSEREAVVAIVDTAIS